MTKFFVLIPIIFLIGCTTPDINLLGRLQSADDALAAKYGVPAIAVKTLRTTLGIPEVKSLPDASRVLPIGWTWKYDLLDANGKVIDQSQFHWDTTPKLIPVSNITFNISNTAVINNPTETLESLLKLLQDNPDLLKAAK